MTTPGSPAPTGRGGLYAVELALICGAARVFAQDSEVPIKTLRRRLVTIPVTVLLFVVLVGFLPVWLLIAVGIDVVRQLRNKTPWAVSRLVLFGAVYLSAQLVGLTALFFAWLFSGFGKNRARLIARTYRIQQIWVTTLFGAVRLIYGVEVELDGTTELGAPPGGP
ncbi:MAG TPA: hypothetical protein PK095_10895, partial [Myxococcota bacterium]|nr:hypothetical protein [Myxococcota bacterium]